MSYARFSPGCDVYVYPAFGGHIACCGCIFGGYVELQSADEAAQHMQAHRDAGHDVPDRLLDPSTYPPEDFQPEDSE